MPKIYDADTMMAKELYKKLHTKKKIKHFWEYYKNVVYFIVILSLIFIGGYILRPVPKPPANLRIKFVNTYVEGQTDVSNPMEADYEAYLGEDNTCQMSFTYSKLSLDNETEAGMNMEDMMIEVVTGNLELFIFDEMAMNKLCPTGFVLDLNSTLSSDVLKQVEEKLVYHKDINGNVVPMAIEITDTKYAKEMGLKGDKVFISFVSNSPNKEVAGQFVYYILSR